MTESNGGSAEYQNIIGNLDNIGDLLEEELLNKKVEEAEVTNPLNGMLALLFPLVGFSNTSGTLHIIKAGLGTNVMVPFTRAAQLGTSIQEATAVVEATKAAVPEMTKGGLRSIINLAVKFGPLLLQVLGIVAGIAFAVYHTLNTFSTIGEEFSQLYERIAALETELGRTTAQLQKANQRIDTANQQINQANQNINTLQTGLINLEKFANQKISELQKQVKGMEELIKKNHAQSMGEFEKVQTKLDVEFLLNKEWQRHNGAEAVATLAAAATIATVERSDGLVKKAADMAEAAKASADEAGNIGKGNGQKIQDAANDAKEKFKKIGMSLDIGIIIDLITMVTSLHNAAMLSRDIVGTCVQTLETGVQAALNMFGYKGATDEAFDLSKILSETFENLAKTVLGAENWATLKAQYAAASKITAGLNGILWAAREIAESTNSLAQSAAENTGKLGNRLIASGVLDDIGQYFPENYSMRSRLGRKMADATGFLQGVLNTAQGFEQFTSEVLSITENVKEIQENVKEVKEGMEQLEPKRTPTNTKVLAEIILENEQNKSPVIELKDLLPAPKEL